MIYSGQGALVIFREFSLLSGWLRELNFVLVACLLHQQLAMLIVENHVGIAWPSLRSRH